MSPAAPTPRPQVEGQAPEMRRVSVLFVDLEGFTTLSERRDAEDVRELLSEHSAAARRVVERYGGTVEKYIGDAVMAVPGLDPLRGRWPARRHEGARGRVTQP